MREKGQTEAAKTLETPVFSRGIEILTEKEQFVNLLHAWILSLLLIFSPKAGKRGFAFQTYLRCFVLQRLRLTKQVTKGILIVC